MYQMPAFVEETDTGKLFRGLKTGDNISDILARIPADSELNLEDISCETGVNIYGSGEMNMFGASLTRNEDGSLQLLVCAFDIITYTLDESLDISTIDVFREQCYFHKKHCCYTFCEHLSQDVQTCPKVVLHTSYLQMSLLSAQSHIYHRRRHDRQPETYEETMLCVWAWKKWDTR